jgi:hypothetical protein
MWYLVETLRLVSNAIRKGDKDSIYLAKFLDSVHKIRNKITFYAPQAEVFLWKELSDALCKYISDAYPEGLEVNKAEDWEWEIIDLIRGQDNLPKKNIIKKEIPK